ncbi:MAG: GNAT family N-acetyltransferase [Anaerolineae bacterium]|nr:GNAT family N-acetyltransferase [Anaerolineae bacterium]
MTIEIRAMQPSDEAAVADICYVTSPWGRDGRENLRHLVALRWCLHYLWHETEHCHVAVDTGLENKVVGYLICAPDTERQEAGFRQSTLHLVKAEIKRLAPRVGIERAKLEKEFFFLPTRNMGATARKVAEDYQAHLHIDIYPDHHRRGIGRLLFAAHEIHLRAIGCPGYHLGVSSSNQQAVQFYTAMGMTDMTHVGGPLNFGIIFAKAL